MTDSNSSSGTPSISPALFDKKNIVIELPQWSAYGETKQMYGKCSILYRNPATGHKLQPCLVLGPPMATYGVSENTNASKTEVTGHSVCFTLPKGESDFDRVVSDIYSACCEFLAENALKCSLQAGISADTMKFMMKSPTQHPKNKETNAIETNKAKRLYAKIVEYKATDKRAAKMVTIFDDATSYDMETRKMTLTLDPLTVISSVEMIPSLLFDTIYLGSKPSIQVKLPRAAVTRALTANSVASCDDTVGEYMRKMTFSGQNDSTDDTSNSGTIDPNTML